MEGGRVNHSWCMAVDSHGYGGLGRGRDGGGGWCLCWTGSGGFGCMSGDVGALPECEVMTPDNTALLVCSSG